MAKGVTKLSAAKRARREYRTALQQQRMIKGQLRKLDDRLKYRNGGMIHQVGLDTIPEELLLGGLILLSRKLQDPKVKAFALKLGKQAMAQQAAKKKKTKGPPEVFIAFPDPPPETLCKQLGGMGLRFNPRNLEWRGEVDYDLMMRAVIAAGWDGYVLRSGYVGASRKDVSASGSAADKTVATRTSGDVLYGSGAKEPLGFTVELEN